MEEEERKPEIYRVWQRKGGEVEERSHNEEQGVEKGHWKERGKERRSCENRREAKSRGRERLRRQIELDKLGRSV